MESKRKAWVFDPGVKVHRAGDHTWDIWRAMPHGPLWKIVALHCGLDPNKTTLPDLTMPAHLPKPPTPEFYFMERLDLAVATVEAGILECIGDADKHWYCKVRLADYAAWAESQGYELPPQFPRARPTAATGTAGISSRWPWGSHTTPLLEHLAAAGEHFWRLKSEGGPFDPDDPTTAPVNKMVEYWLEEQGVYSRENKEVMARLLRAPKLPLGRPPSRWSE